MSYLIGQKYVYQDTWSILEVVVIGVANDILTLKVQKLISVPITIMTEVGDIFTVSENQKKTNPFLLKPA